MVETHSRAVRSPRDGVARPAPPEASVAGMCWASSTFPCDGWYDVLGWFEEEYDAAGSPSDMMLCRAETPEETTIFIGMPVADMLEGYDDFERCLAPVGVDHLRLLMGDERVFDDLFHRRRPVGALEPIALPGTSKGARS